MSLKQTIQNAASEALQSVYNLTLQPAELTVQPTDPRFEGDLTVVLFPLLKMKIGKPAEIGQALGERLTALSEVASFNVVQGYLNLKIADSFWLNFLDELKQIGESWFNVADGAGQTVMVEYPSPNSNKPLHLGHLRNIFLGESVSRILIAAGYKTIKACLYNDKGIHVCKSMHAWLESANGATPESTGTKGDHFVGDYYVQFENNYKPQVTALVAQGMSEDEAKRKAPLFLEVSEMYRQWEAGAPEVVELWKRMNSWVYDGHFATYKRVGVSFDQLYYESETYLLGRQFVKEGLKEGVFYRKDDNSVWIDLTEQGLDHKLVLRADGTSVYITQDLGAAELKYNQYHINKSIYVIGNEQDYHMKVLIEILKKLKKPYADGLYHLSYGMVELPTGRMKTREGTVVDADDILQEMFEAAEHITNELGKVEGLSQESLNELYETIGQGALKYFLLKVDPVKRMVFNPEESVDFKGDTGPFIQYTHARVHGILRRAALESLALPEKMPNLTLNQVEIDIIKRLYAFREALSDAARTYSPSVMANYVYDLAKAYNRFHSEAPVLKAETAELAQFRLALSSLTAMGIQYALKLLGISSPERM